MKVLQVTHLFAPDHLAGASLYTDMAAFFHEQGHDIRVTTTFPYYPALNFAPEDRGVLWRNEVKNGIPVRRVGMWLPQPHSGWRRLVPELAFLSALTLVGAPADWEPDVIITASPMLAQAAWQHVNYPGRHIPRLLVVQDTMAHAATELGIIKNRWLGRALHLFEKWALQSCELHSTISTGMQIRVKSISDGKIPCLVTPNWIHSSLAKLVDERRSTEGIIPRSFEGGLFYSGNFGVKQGLPQFLDLMQEARGSWKMNIHGGGAEVRALEDSALSRTDWLTVGGLLTESDYVDCLLRVGACVITQMPGVGANFLPSKLLPAFAAGVPVLAVCERGSPLGADVAQGGYGEVVEPHDARGLANILNRWADSPDELGRLGNRAKQRAKLFSRDEICGRYEEVLSDLVASCRQRIH